MQGLLRTGIVLLLLAFAVWFYKDQEHELPLSSQLDHYLAFAGAACIAGFLIILLSIKIFGITWKTTRAGRCARCRKKVRKGEIYCSFHQKEVQAEYLAGLVDDSRPKKHPPSGS